MKKLTDIKSIAELMKNDRAIKIIVAAGLIVIVLIFLSDFLDFGGTAENAANTGDDSAAYAAELEEKLVALISEIEGAGRVKIMITLETSDENVYSAKETAVTTVKAPVVRGVAVVCEGGGDVLVKSKIVETVSKVLGISTARVCVTY